MGDIMSGVPVTAACSFKEPPECCPCIGVDAFAAAITDSNGKLRFHVSFPGGFDLKFKTLYYNGAFLRSEGGPRCRLSARDLAKLR
jgi:hypothetical protein